MNLTLATPIQFVPGVGPARSKLLKKLGVETVQDLLYYVPFRYDDFSLVSPIARVQPGETVTVEGTITAFKNSFTKTGKKLQEAKIADGTGTLAAIWFNQPFLARVLPVGTRVRLAGKIDWFGNKIVLTSPSYEIGSSLHTGRLVPVYPETEGITSKWLRGRIALVLEHALGEVVDAIPDFGLMPLRRAIAAVHFPKTKEEAAAARHRLAFNELFLLQLRAWEERRIWQETKTSYRCRIDHGGIEKFLQSLRFPLTNDQRAAVKEILADLAKPYPMNRLLEGDVGAGKTVVAMIAMFVAHANGLRSVLMAPTQILAEQHYATIKGFLSPFGIGVQLVTGTDRIGHQRLAKEHEKQQPSIFVGTHALLSRKRKLDRLGLVVIDEQQRFGVAQRSALIETAEKTPHLLTMTATPIPRTVARVAMGNLDLSILTTIPGERKKVQTWVVPNEKRTAAYAWISRQIRAYGGQAFVICPLIEASETRATAKSATMEFERLTSLFPQLRLGLLHGRLKEQEKKDVLDAFRRGEIHMLVTTPVVEVGIDVPNATIMLIEGAERFGLSQLHQLRGRVGRGTQQSYCLLFTDATDAPTITRLKAMETTHSGPLLAERDMQLRGPGEPFGTRQHGIPQMKIAQWTDAALIAQTREAVKTITSRDPTLASFPLLRETLKTRTIPSTHAD